MDTSTATEISKDDHVSTGDILIIQYKIMSFFTNTQVANIFKNLLGKPYTIMEYEVIKHSWLNDYLQVKVKVTENPIPVIAIIAGLTIAATSLFIYLSFDTVYKITSSPGGGETVSKFSTGFLIFAAAALGFVGIKALKAWKS